VTRDVLKLRSALNGIVGEVEKPGSRILGQDKAKSEELANIIKGHRPILEQLDKLVTKDRGLKKKRIWRPEKDNTAALAQIHMQLDFQIQSINLFLSSRMTTQIALIEKKLEAFVTEFGREHRDESLLGTTGDADRQAEAQWARFRNELVEDGITEADIEEHKSSIKALLREGLPSYSEAHLGHARSQGNQQGPADTAQFAGEERRLVISSSEKRLHSAPQPSASRSSSKNWGRRQGSQINISRSQG
jgi:hypothetical protein